MEVYISINGPLRNLIQKFDYHYKDEFLDSDFMAEEVTEEGTKEDPFDYQALSGVQNDNLLDYYTFQSVDEYNNFLFVDFPLEIFGHAGITTMSAMSDLNKMIHDNPDINFTVVGLDELGKAKSSTLFFLSKHSYLGNNVRFIRTAGIKKEWKKCDLWITDNKDIIDLCPKKKTVVKYLTDYNEYFTHKNEVKNLTECLKYWEKPTTSMWTRLFRNVAPKRRQKNLPMVKTDKSN